MLQEFREEVELAMKRLEFSEAPEAELFTELEKINYQLCQIEDNKTIEHLEENKRKPLNASLKNYYSLFDFHFGTRKREDIMSSAQALYLGN